MVDYQYILNGWRYSAMPSSVYRTGVNIYIIRDIENHKCEQIVGFTTKEIDEGTMFTPEASLALNLAQAQELIDSLWQCGIRPSEGTGSAGQLAAVQYHLEDMRKLVFKSK